MTRSAYDLIASISATFHLVYKETFGRFSAKDYRDGYDIIAIITSMAMMGLPSALLEKIVSFIFQKKISEEHTTYLKVSVLTKTTSV